MPSIHRPLLRLAAVIAAQLAARHNSEPLLELPKCSWDRCSELVRQISTAEMPARLLRRREAHQKAAEEIGW
jgi:hypothetical protein